MFSGLVFCNDCKQKLYYPPPAILKSGRTSSSALPIVPTRISAADIISVLLCWNKSSGSTFRRSYR